MSRKLYNKLLKNNKRRYENHFPPDLIVKLTNSDYLTEIKFEERLDKLTKDINELNGNIS